MERTPVELSQFDFVSVVLAPQIPLSQVSWAEPMAHLRCQFVVRAAFSDEGGEIPKSLRTPNGKTRRAARAPSDAGRDGYHHTPGLTQGCRQAFGNTLQDRRCIEWPGPRPRFEGYRHQCPAGQFRHDSRNERPPRTSELAG